MVAVNQVTMTKINSRNIHAIVDRLPIVRCSDRIVCLWVNLDKKSFLTTLWIYGSSRLPGLAYFSKSSSNAFKSIFYNRKDDMKSPDNKNNDKTMYTINVNYRIILRISRASRRWTEQQKKWIDCSSIRRTGYHLALITHIRIVSSWIDSPSDSIGYSPTSEIYTGHWTLKF